MVRRFRAFVVLALASCMAPPPVTRPIPQTDVAAPFDRTWTALIDFLTTSQLPIKATEKASGLATTETLAIDKWERHVPRSSALCDLRLSPDSVSVTFVVRGDSVKSFVRATARFRDGTGDDCTTTHALEQSWESEIRKSAELLAKP